ncbi:MAG: 4-hydroxy-tetrahydrodipicolinate synthase, partial [Deltaproteobacteria bacterium]|nr:4-hydroxy-tetrahydrodipicolinate synthase [Deltaproteobacteria bacterium]
MTTRSSWVSTMRGAWTALATPMKDGGVDEEALRALVDRQVAGGITGLIPCGTTGESATMSPAEQARVVRIVVEQNAKRAPVFAGAGTLSTAVSTDLARAAREAGADGLLLVTPYYNKPTQAGLIAHYRAILRDVPMPAILYNVPSRTMCDLQADTVAQLAEIPEVVAVKEASGNVLRTQEILERTGDRLSVLSGDDPL